MVKELSLTIKYWHAKLNGSPQNGRNCLLSIIDIPFFHPKDAVKFCTILMYLELCFKEKLSFQMWMKRTSKKY